MIFQPGNKEVKRLSCCLQNSETKKETLLCFSLIKFLQMSQTTKIYYLVRMLLRRHLHKALFVFLCLFPLPRPAQAPRLLTKRKKWFCFYHGIIRQAFEGRKLPLISSSCFLMHCLTQYTNQIMSMEKRDIAMNARAILNI